MNKKRGCNLGCGNQHFESNENIEWINMDLNDRDGKIEVAGDVSQPLPFENETFDIMVASHILEHLEMSIAEQVIKEWMRCLKKDGKLIITVPNGKALARAYINGKIDNYIFAVNMTGPYHNSVADHHRWVYDRETMIDRTKEFDYEIFCDNEIGIQEPDLLPEETKGKVALDYWILGFIIKFK